MQEEFSFDSLKKPIKPVFKGLFVIGLLVCIGASLALSFFSVSLDLYEFKDVEGKWQLYAFHNDDSLSSLNIDFVYENGVGGWKQNTDKPVAFVRQYAVCCDSSITDIYIGKDVEVIEGQAFYYCTALQAFHVDVENPYYCDVDGILYTKDLTEIVAFPIDYCSYEGKNISIRTVETAEGGTNTNALLMSYALPDTVKVIGETCFYNVKNLEAVTLNAGLEEIQTLAFFKCNALTGVELPDGLKEIGSDAFSYCSGITDMFLPATVETIGHHAFYKCNGLAEIRAERSESDFKAVKKGDGWLPQVSVSGANLFKKNVPIRFDQPRECEV